MKHLVKRFGISMIVMFVGYGAVSAQAGGPAQDNNSDTASGLDLYAVAELFKDSEDLEKFEQALNDPERGLNNIDLNRDNKVDFIRAVEQNKDDTHLVILQVPMGEDDYQDVATIAVERDGGGADYNLQIQGDTLIYGADYYVVPSNRNFGTWNIVRWIFSPGYRPYTSRYSYAVRPLWWRDRQPVTTNIYRGRTTLYRGRGNFVAARTMTVRTVSKIGYRARTSPIFARKTSVIRTTTIKKAPAIGNPKSPVVKTRTRVIKVKKH